MDWATVQMLYGENNPPAADGYAAVYFDGEVLSKLEYGASTGMCWLETGGEPLTVLRIGNQASPATAGPPPQCDPATLPARSYYDHVYLDTSFMRVEVGNAASYDDCTNRMIQIPVTWVDDEIVFTAKRGMFAVDVPLWLFVLDADNTVIYTTEVVFRS